MSQVIDGYLVIILQVLAGVAVGAFGVLGLVLMPLVALGVARHALGLSAAEVLTVVLLAALPTAQNVFTYADRYEADVVVVRDAVLVTMPASLPVLLLSVVLR